jgi:hypothetical protein
MKQILKYFEGGNNEKLKKLGWIVELEIITM